VTFDGFTADAFAFYTELKANNSKTWWLENKKRYEQSVAIPLNSLADQLEPEFGSVKVFRPYRDVRFSADKTPYKEHAALVIEQATGGGALYFQFSDVGFMIAGGAWQPAPDQLARFRAAVDDHRSIEHLEQVLADLENAGYVMGSDGALKTAPRGWRADHPKIDLLRRTSLAVAHHEPAADWMHTESCLPEIQDGWRTVQRWNAWLAEVVGPPDTPRSRPGRG
jgi:uncharacterized protein (TIGR02453 family)